MTNRFRLLQYAVEQHANDIHICAGAPVLFRIGGKLLPVTEEVLTPEKSQEIIFELLSDEQRLKLQEELDNDLMLATHDARFRINVGYFNGSVGAIIRVLAGAPKTTEELGLPDTVKELAQLDKGLVLITGSTSVGKTTTMASMIDHINRTQKKHIITIEDPIEYLHENKKGIVRQREIGKDTKSFQRGLRAALRQDPDVIAIGEMRDYETIKIALTAAETGILVLSTLHVISIDKMIERLLSYAPDESEGTVRFLLAESLQGVVHQELVPLISGGQRVATEILTGTNGARNIIRRKGGYFLRSVIATGKKHGMRTMTESINALLEEGVILEDTAARIVANYGN